MRITAIYPDRTTREYNTLSLEGMDFLFHGKRPCYFVVSKGTSAEDKSTLTKLCRHGKVSTQVGTTI